MKNILLKEKEKTVLATVCDHLKECIPGVKEFQAPLMIVEIEVIGREKEKAKGRWTLIM